ncbi:MAG: hypothetical protein ACLRYB_00250 [Segatella copri]
MNTGLDQYMDIFKDAVEDSAAKLTKSFEKILIEVIILFMVIPRKINFTQMGGMARMLSKPIATHSA